MKNKLKFKYYRGPIEDMSALCDDKKKCTFCGNTDIAFELDSVICSELLHHKQGKFGCVDCLKKDRFGFWHDTDAGVIDEAGLLIKYNDKNIDTQYHFSKHAVEELRRTPKFLTWKKEQWPTHCNDFMIYLGTWNPIDFYINSATRNGRELFINMTDAYDHLWDDSLIKEKDTLTEWNVTYYAFQCTQCYVLKGYWEYEE